MKNSFYNILKIVRWIFELRDPNAQRRIDNAKKSVDIADIYKSCGSFEGIIMSKDIAIRNNLITKTYTDPILIFGFMPMVSTFDKKYGNESHDIDHSFYLVLDINTMNIIDVIYKYHDKSSILRAYDAESMFSNIVDKQLFSSIEIDLTRLKYLAQEGISIYRKIRLEFNMSVYIEVIN